MSEEQKPLDYASRPKGVPDRALYFRSVFACVGGFVMAPPVMALACYGIYRNHAEANAVSDWLWADLLILFIGSCFVCNAIVVVRKVMKTYRR